MGIRLHLISIIVAYSFGMYWLQIEKPRELKQIKPIYKTKEWFHEALPYFLLGGISIINSKLSMVLSGVFLPIEEVGFYKIAVVGSSLVSFLLISVNTSIGPLIGEMYYGNRKKELQKMLTKTVQIVSLIGFVISIIYVFLGKFFIDLVYGTEYAPAYTPLIILTIGHLINASAGSVQTILSMTGNQRNILRGQIIAALLNIVLNCFLLPFFGIVGGAIATSISLMVWNIILVREVKIKLGLNSSILNSKIKEI
jgi:O-antigen/teichoic acid export membrane protein